MKLMKISIMQPTYLPWIGYFGMIYLSDIFIFYNDVQFVKRSWQNRNKIKTPHGWSWLTVPVISNFKENINEIRLNNDLNWREKHLKAIEFNYRNAPYFNEFYETLKELYNTKYEFLEDLNINFIKTIAKFLNINTKFLVSSDLKSDGAKTDRLISVINNLKNNDKCDYLTVPGTKDYIEPIKFEEKHIKLFWYYFIHPKYPQLFGDFCPYMSIIDLILNVGNKEALRLIKKGNENSLKEKPIDV